MRPWRLAGPARATSSHSPVTKSRTSTASPTAKMSGSLVRMCSSTRMPPRSPTSRPAAFARVVSGRTPSARMTMWAVWAAPDSAVTMSGLIRTRCKRSHTVIGHDANTVPAQVVTDEAPEFDIKRRQDVTASLEDGDVEAPMDEVLGHLQADEPAADDHSALGWSDGLETRVALHPSQEAGALLDPLPDGSGVRHRANLEDARQIDPGQRWADGRRPRREHQLVVGLRRRLAGGVIEQRHGVVLWRDGRDLAACPAVDGELLAEDALVRHQQMGLLLDDPADVVRQSAVGERDVRSALDHRGCLPSRPTGEVARHRMRHPRRRRR